MALPIKSFRGKISGKTIYDITSDINYSIDKQSERLEFIQELLQDENNQEYFDVYFDKYFKFNPNMTDYLSWDMNIPKKIENMADYLLFAPDAPRPKKQKYNFYKDERLFEKVVKREKSLTDIASKTEEFDECYKSDDYDDIMDYYLVKYNSKIDKSQIITNEDFKDKDFDWFYREYNKDTGEIHFEGTKNLLQSYKDFIDYYKPIYESMIKDAELKLKEMNLDNNQYKTELNKIKKQKYFIREFFKYYNSNLKIIKTQIKKTIWFKSPLPDEGIIDWSMINYGNPEHISALLRISPSNNLSTDMGAIIYDLTNLINECKFTEEDLKIIDLYRIDDKLQSKIADVMGVTQSAISQKIQSLSNRISKKYNEIWEDWIYTEWVKGKYKKCSKCGEVKLIKFFGKWNRSSDGLRPECKNCR